VVLVTILMLIYYFTPNTDAYNYLEVTDENQDIGQEYPRIPAYERLKYVDSQDLQSGQSIEKDKPEIELEHVSHYYHHDSPGDNGHEDHMGHAPVDSFEENNQKKAKTFREQLNK
jgi:hypothetical protein